MRDPIRDFESIRDFYITYLETAFRIGDEDVQRRRRELLERLSAPWTFCTDPLVEPLPQYRTAGLRIDDLAGSAGEAYLPGYSVAQREAFVRLAKAGLMPVEAEGAEKERGAFELYGHQLEMIRRGASEGLPGIVTSGTGSGKTEAFLLPILATLAKEALTWPASPDLGSAERWWAGPDGQVGTEADFAQECRLAPEGRFVPRRKAEAPDRPRAIRALVLYPMNALVEDQMVRLRKALDSERAHAFMDQAFGGNRVFFGRYTSATPVTGFLRHPRLGRRYRQTAVRRLTRLWREITMAERTYDEALQEALRSGDSDLPYNFPRVGGAELFSRWDMQAAPPDLLITNTSMLSALLMREVEEPLWDSTRDWLEKSDDAYFFLVLDELHLQRGTAGTEVAYLLKVLLDRLGLSRPEHRHKLRVLASSASLPVEGEARADSIAYLWEMFGQAGHGRRVVQPGAWADAVVAGSVEPAPPLPPTRVKAADFISLVDQCLDESSPRDVANNGAEWTRLSDLIGAEPDDAWQDLGATVQGVVRRAADLISAGCDTPFGARATPVGTIGERIFGDSEHSYQAASALLRLRGSEAELNDLCSQYRQSDPVPLERYRIHLFMRALEGLFAAPQGLSDGLSEQQRRDRLFTQLGVERGLSFGTHIDGGLARFVELLYCECCGELFFGGIRGTGSPEVVELLPADPDPDNLPEQSKPQLFEQLSARDFAVFWPTTRRYWPWGPDSPREGDAQARWRMAQYDPVSGRVGSVGPSGDWMDGQVPGYLYDVRAWRANGQAPSDAGSAVPHQCPFCGESYRRRRTRRSPIRNFRVGFAKTSQLLASELVARMRANTERPDEVKLVSFADSRQDAARAALDLESRHHEDLRREFLVKAIREAFESRADPARLEARLGEIERELEGDGSFAEKAQLIDEGRDIEEQLSAAAEDSIPIKDVLDVQGGSVVGHRLKPVTERFVAAGVHPIDPAGVAPIVSGEQEFAWQELFRGRPGDFQWNDDPARREDLASAQLEVRNSLKVLTMSTVFHRSYFALEEAGLGYPCLAKKEIKSNQRAPFDALVRILGDLWLYRPGSDTFGPPTPWTSADGRVKIREFARAVWGDQWQNGLEAFLQELERQGHASGILQAENLRIKPASAEDSFWRCSNCGRVHLHRGAQICTRCNDPLSRTPTGTVKELWAHNYLAKRVEDPSPALRLRAEDLTAMTSNPGARLRRFKGVLVNDVDDILPQGVGLPVPAELDRAARVVDLLSVTTTMEVGVDIGSLGAIFQANMPPQRFNYQQRVGRAGRRGQAFSAVLTICRSKSHDLHYFRNPGAITGDPPPPPFLTGGLANIGQRLLRKAWLWKAFRLLREEASGRGEEWPADDMTPPDIHGEFMTVDDYQAGLASWEPRLQRALGETIAFRDGLAEWFCQTRTLDPRALLVGMSPDDILSELRAIDPGEHGSRGIGEALAERGALPMYGMPTRVRSLYTGMRRGIDGSSWAPDSIDRDLEVAVQEFAPGKYLIRDKRRHQSVGFTGALPPQVRVHGSWGNVQPLGHAFGAEHHLAECSACRGWVEATTEDAQTGLQCGGCGAQIAADRFRTCVVPNGFRTRFRPTAAEADFDPTPSQRVAMAEVARPRPLTRFELESRSGIPAESENLQAESGQA